MVAGPIVKLFSKPLSTLLQRQASELACAQVRSISSGIIKDKLAAFNHFMLPKSLRDSNVHPMLLDRGGEDEQRWATFRIPRVVEKLFANSDESGAQPTGQTAKTSLAERRLGSGRPDTVDWSQDATVRWVSWLLNDVIGPEGIDQAARWAWKNSSSAAIPGPVFPILNSSFQQPGSSLKLQTQIFLRQAVIEGGQSISGFSPLKAAGPNDLVFNLSFGTKEEPSLGIGLNVMARVEAIDVTSSTPPTSIDQEMQLHLGLTEPAVAVEAEVLVDAERWPGSRTLAQLLVDPKGCTTSVLVKAPKVRKLNVGFKGVAAPLSFVAKARSPLEESIAALLNNCVTLFNNIYETFLPAAISHLADSDEALKLINDAAASNLQPGHCTGASRASAAVKDIVPEKWGNWPAVFDNFLHDWLDNFIDGFLQHNTSKLTRGFSAMPPVFIPPVENFKVREILATGMDHVRSLSLMQTNPSERNELGIQAAVNCPTSTEPWRPAVAVNGSLQAGHFGGDGVVRAEAPCGTLKGQANIELDLWSLLDLEVPPSAACALLTPLSRFDVVSFEANFGGEGTLIVQHTDGPEQRPLQELCQLHPQACALMRRLGHAISDTGGISHLVDALRKLLLSQCTGDSVQAQAPGMKDTLGYSYSESNAVLWLCSFLATAALAVLCIFCAELGRRQSTDGEDLRKLSLATQCWCGSLQNGSKILPKVGTFAISFLVASGLVGRILACWWLLYISTGAGVMQKSSGEEVLPEQMLLKLTYFGLSEQFSRGGSLYCHNMWVLTSCVAAFAANAVLLVVWLTPLLAPLRRTLLWSAVLLGRFALSEMETIGNSVVALDSIVELPLGLEATISTRLHSGAYTSLAAASCTIIAALALLRMVPCESHLEWSKGKASGRLSILQGCASVAMILGLTLWLLCPYLHVETLGLAGAMVAPASRAARDVATSDAVLGFGFVTCCYVAPLLQIASFGLGEASRRYDFKLASPAALSALAEFAAAFSLLDLFTLGYVLSFLGGVNPFAASAVHEIAKPVCEFTQSTIGEDCLGVDVSVAAPGFIGLLLALMASLSFVAVQVIGVGQGSSRRAVETDCSNP
eukprot:TRINITY_DN106506_c0_g1_i1.p1 TRINITY_DN106506_c0_g1~~TRINITY_DN106506_c0_g1_i1.p1  ORF type:complete len:1265 (+),score=245.40 TRINITY_DN106506_c0_g1_i1:527-3796(+)